MTPITTLLALALAAVLAPTAALPIPHEHHYKRDAAPAPAVHMRREQLPVPQGGSFHNETHWWVPDTVHHGLVDAGQQKGDNTAFDGQRVQMHVVGGRARTSWA